MIRIFTKIKNWMQYRKEKRDVEYSKRLLNQIVGNSLLMMWASYILAFLGMTQIAETLSSTIASTIIAVVVGYLTKSTIENISKYTGVFDKKDAHSEQSPEQENSRAE